MTFLVKNTKVNFIGDKMYSLKNVKFFIPLLGYLFKVIKIFLSLQKKNSSFNCTQLLSCAMFISFYKTPLRKDVCVKLANMNFISSYNCKNNMQSHFSPLENVFASLMPISWVQVCKQESTGLLYKRIVNLFQSFFTFYMKSFLNEIFCNLLLKIHIVAPIDHMFCVNRF